MKKLVGLLMIMLLVLGSCGPKPYYETAEGKKKLKHYNRIQYGQNNQR